MIVDSHVHLLPGRLGEKVRAFFSEYEPYLAYPNDHRVVCEAMAAAGVDALWTLPYAHKPGVADGLNRSTAEIGAGDWPVNIVNGCTVHPGDDDPARIVSGAVERFGARVLKLHSSVGSFDADDRRLDDVWRYCADARLPVVVHVGHGVDGQTSAAELAPIDRVATRFPDVRLIIAHTAALAVSEALDLIERHPHLYGDLTPVLVHRVEIPIDRLDAVADRLLFGSDAPNTGFLVNDLLDHVRAWPLPPERLDAILGGTATGLVEAVRTG